MRDEGCKNVVLYDKDKPICYTVHLPFNFFLISYHDDLVPQKYA